VVFRFTLLCAFAFFLSLPAWAQQSQIDKIRELEAERNSAHKFAMDRKLDSAVLLIEQGEYDLADRKLKAILQSSKSVGSELTFYFGKNSYLLGSYKQSIDWLNKYIQLKGTTGQFSNEAVEWLHKSETELLKEKQTLSQQVSTVFSTDYTIDCGPTGKVTCPVCKGTTVIIKRNYLGENYSTCPYCAKNGYLNCEDYNKLIRGQLKASAK
jgi:tetratricopeptide (TPR) repeat protein